MTAVMFAGGNHIVKAAGSVKARYTRSRGALINFVFFVAFLMRKWIDCLGCRIRLLRIQKNRDVGD